MELCNQMKLTARYRDRTLPVEVPFAIWFMNKIKRITEYSWGLVPRGNKSIQLRDLSFFVLFFFFFRSIYKVKETFQIKSVDLFWKFKQMKFLEEQINLLNLIFNFL